MLQNGNTLAHKVAIEDAKIVIKSILPSRIFCLVLANIFSKILYRIDFQKNKIKTQSNKRDLNFNFFPSLIANPIQAVNRPGPRLQAQSTILLSC